MTTNLLEIQQWFSKNSYKLTDYVGKWVAVSRKGVVESAPSLAALSKKLDEEQRSTLLLTRIPTRKEASNLVV